MILLKDGNIVPTDCIVLQTAKTNGECFILTDALDGERNLKPRMALKQTNQHMDELLGNINQPTFTVHVQKPSKELYEFVGEIEI